MSPHGSAAALRPQYSPPSRQSTKADVVVEGPSVNAGGALPNTPLSANHLTYEATIEDPQVFTRPWKITMPLYRRIDRNVRLLEFKCPEVVEEVHFGPYRKVTPRLGSGRTSRSRRSPRAMLALGFTAGTSTRIALEVWRDG